MAAPSTPHATPLALVGVASAVLSYISLRSASRSNEFPGHVVRWPRTAVTRLAGALRKRNRDTAAWVALFLWSTLVSALHFGGLQYGLYTRYFWWDILTHWASGVGVAVLLQLTFPEHATGGAAGEWIPLTVLSIGAGFEVYEFLLKTFWYAWSLEFYLTDTLVDLLFAVLGAHVAVVVTPAYLRWEIHRSASETLERAGRIR